MSQPIGAPVCVLKRIPQDLREWDRELFDLGRGVRTNGKRTFAADQRFLHQVASANKLSVQSVQPLTSNDLGGGFADIQVAAFSLQYAHDQVSYNSGAITGLLNSTLYYCFFDDPNFDGGAVTYEATTDPLNITADLGRVYLGSITTDAPAGGGSSGGWGGGGGGNGHPLP